MLKNTIRNINNRLDETSPKVYSHADWDHSSYNFDSASYNYDNYEVTPIEDEQSAYLSMCALADYSQGAVGSLGGISAGSVENVHLDGMETHKECLSSIGSTMETTLQNMGKALNVRYTAEMEAAGLFGGKPGELLDLAGQLRGIANEHSSEILDEISSFGQNTGAPTSPLTGERQYDESIFTNPEKLASTYNSISQKDPSTWTQEERIIVMAYYDDLQGRAAQAKAEADKAGLYSYDPSLWDEYSGLYSESKQLEKVLKAEGMMDESGWDKFTGGTKEVLATGVEGYATIYAGIAKVLEFGYDARNQMESWGKTAVDFVRSTAALIAGDEETAAAIAAASKERSARDKEFIALPLTETIYHVLFGGTTAGQAIDSQSALKHDSELAGNIMDTTTNVTKGALATAMMTSGVGIPLTALGGFTLGIGETAEDRYNMENKDDAFIENDALAIAVGAAGKAAEFTGEGVMGSNLIGAGKAIKTVASSPKTIAEIVKKTGSVIVEHPITWNDVINKRTLSSIGNSMYKGVTNNFISVGMETAAPFGDLSLATNADVAERDIPTELGEAYVRAAGRLAINLALNGAEGVVLNTANTYASRAFSEAITDYLDSGRVYTDVAEKLDVDESMLREHDFSVSVKNASTDDYLAKNPTLMGYSNSATKSVVLSSDHFISDGNLAKSYDELYGTAVHEALHQMSTDSNGRTTGLGSDGINEATTEYLARKVTGAGRGYPTLVPELERIVDSGVLSEQTLKDGYFNPTQGEGLKEIEREIANNIIGVTNNKYDAANAYALTDAFQYAYDSLNDGKQHKQDLSDLRGVVDDVIGLFTGTK